MIKLTPNQEEHGYVEACVDAILTQKWNDLHVDLDDVRKWNVDLSTKPYLMRNPAPLAERVANELAASAVLAERPSLAIPAERIAGDIYYTLLERKTAFTNEGKFATRALDLMRLCRQSRTSRRRGFNLAKVKLKTQDLDSR